MPKKQDIILTLGVPRSGFSVLGACLSLLGCNTVFSEGGDVAAWHDALLRDLGRRWDMVGNLPQGWEDSESADVFIRRVKTVLEHGQNHAVGPLVVIAPHAARILPAWRKMCAETNLRIRIITLVRHPVETALSLHKHHGLDLLKGLPLWYLSNCSALEAGNEFPYAMLTYDQLVANPVQCLHNLAQQTGQSWPRPVQEVNTELLDAVQPGLKNHHAGDRLPGGINAGSFVQFYTDLQACTVRKSQSPQSFVPVMKQHNVVPTIDPENMGMRCEGVTEGATHAHQDWKSSVLTNLLELIGHQEQREHTLEEREKTVLAAESRGGELYAEVMLKPEEATGATVQESSQRFLLSENEWQKISVDIPDVSICRHGRVIVCPLNTTGMVSISAMRLINPGTEEPIWAVDAGTGFDGCECLGDLLVVSKSNALMIAALGADQQVVLPQLVDVPDGPIRLEVWIKASVNLATIRKYCGILSFEKIPKGIAEPDVLKRVWSIEPEVLSGTYGSNISSILLGTLNPEIKNNYINILLCAQPKSASLYFSELLSRCLNFKNHQIGFNLGAGGMYYPRLLAAKFMKCHTLSHCHAVPERDVLQSIKTLHLYPIILTRNLLDSLISRRDMLLRDKSILPANFLSRKGYEKFIDGTNEYQIDIIIELFADIYINFYYSWSQYFCDDHVGPNVLHITYEQLIEKEKDVVSKIARALGVDINEENIKEKSLEIRKSGGINFSTGIAGRGAKLMTTKHIDRLKEKANIFGCRDGNFLGFKL